MSRGRLLALVSICALGATLTGPQCEPVGTVYTLEEGSFLLTGCIVGPCLCPIAQADLEGSFRLVELPTAHPGPDRWFELRDLEWTLPNGEEVRGTGLYTNAAPVNDDQRLTLELIIDEEPVDPMDSGVVPGGLAYPAIDIFTITGGECFQTAVQLMATPNVGADNSTQPAD